MYINYRLFIYEELDNSIRKYYWMQIKDSSNWLPVTDELFIDLEEEGWIEDLEYGLDDGVCKGDLVYKELDLIEEDKNGLINYYYNIIEDFNEFDIEIKNTQKYPFKMIDFIDYQTGSVFIVKYNK